jgi:hypothetical protein
VPRLTASHGRLPQTFKAKQTEEIVESEICTNKPPKIRIVQHSFAGGLWCAAWLFTIGYLHLTFWKGVLAIVLWPYYIGVHVSTLIR